MKVHELIKLLQTNVSPDAEVGILTSNKTPNSVEMDSHGTDREFIRPITELSLIKVKSKNKYIFGLKSVPYFLFELTCMETSLGWGIKGAKKEMCAPGYTSEEAETFVKLHIPNNWGFKLVGPTTETFYLSS